VSQADPAGPDAGSSEPPAAVEIPFIDRLRRCIDERQADGQGVALLLVDCGLIGRVDVLWGYQVGDAVRTRIVSSLREGVLRPGDFIGELGRDDLACVLSAIEGPQMALLAAEKLLRTLNAPLWLGEEEVYASPSIGIAAFQGQKGNAESLMRQAKSACVAASGLAGHIALYDEGQDTQASPLVRESRLRSAIAEDALELVFQPQFDLRFGQIMGLESKLRWSGGTRELVSMRDAIAAAEAGGMVTKLISSVLNRALRNCSEFRQRAGLDLRIAVNLPARALLQAELPELVERALRTWALRAGRLVLEIEDVSVLESFPETQAAIRRLHEMGVKLSIDDTRASLASLFWLATMPFKELKLDLSAAPDWMAQSRSEGVLRSLVELAHHLELEVVAVGVQGDAAAAKVAELGCDFLQADFRSPPVDAEAFVARFAD
jgi:diguanylate cyclase (GGDEF)-like protein